MKITELTINERNFLIDLGNLGHSYDDIKNALEDGEFLHDVNLTIDETENIHDFLKNWIEYNGK